jgi:hypothetical protein
MKKLIIIVGVCLFLLMAFCGEIISLDKTASTSRVFCTNQFLNFNEFQKTQAALSGDYTIGSSSCNFATITSAVASLNSNGVSGPVRFLLCDASYTTGETFPITFNITSNLPTSVNTVTFKPNSGITCLIRGAPTNDQACNPLLLIKSSYIIIDGYNSADGTSRDLTIENTGTIFPEVIAIRSTGTTPISGFTVKNCILKNGINTSNNNPAIHFAASDYSYGYYNNLTLRNNSFQKAFSGITIYGFEAAGNGSGSLFTENDLNSSGTNAITGTAIYVNGADGITISDNNIGNISSVDDQTITGIRIGTRTRNAEISGNVISNITSTSLSNGTAIGILVTPSSNVSSIIISNNSISTLTCSGTGANFSGICTSGKFINVSDNTVSALTQTGTAPAYGILQINAVNSVCSGNIISGITSSASEPDYGIKIQGVSTDVSVSKNKISNVKNTYAFGDEANGITLASTSTTANITLSNNVISDIAGYGKNNLTERNGYGINLQSGGGYNIYYNSVNLATGQSLATGIPACLIINTAVNTASSLDIRNNIFSIPAATGTNRYAVICNSANTVFSNINFNCYYTSGTNIGYIGAANKTDLSAWQTATGKDKFSVSGNPGFTSATDLTPDAANPNCWTLNGGGYPISSVSSDYNNVSRRTSLPGAANDIGAYEFTPSVSPNPATVNTAGNVTTILSSGTTLATITKTAGTMPSLSALYYPGENPPVVYAGAKFGNSHLDITATGGSGYTYNIVYQFNLAMLGTISGGDYSNSRLAKYSSGSWEYYSSVPNGTNYNITVNGLTGFSSFTICDGNAPLPVKLSSFTSSVINRNVILNWQTISENNNAGFNVERKYVNTNPRLRSGQRFIKHTSQLFLL